MAKTIVLPNVFFEEVANQLREGIPVRVKVQGESMYPALHSGDTIELKPYQGEDLPLYCALFYRWKGHYMTHRLVGAEGDTLTMYGDGNIYQYEHICRSDVMGVLVSCQRPSGTRTDCLSARWLSRGHLWYRLRFMRKVLIKVLRVLRW